MAASDNKMNKEIRNVRISITWDDDISTHQKDFKSFKELKEFLLKHPELNKALKAN